MRDLSAMPAADAVDDGAVVLWSTPGEKAQLRTNLVLLMLGTLTVGFVGGLLVARRKKG